MVKLKIAIATLSEFRLTIYRGQIRLINLLTERRHVIKYFISKETVYIFSMLRRFVSPSRSNDETKLGAQTIRSKQLSITKRFVVEVSEFLSC